MHIVALNGSPNKEGNTFFLLNHATEFLNKEYGVNTSIINVPAVMNKLKNPFCVVCSNPCSGKCYSGTELDKALQVITESDGLLIGSPVYFGTISAQLKAFWDKTRKLRGEKKFLNLVGGVVTVGAARFGGQETTMKAIYDMMLVQGMVIVGDGHKNFDCGHHGAAGVKPAEEDQNAIKRTEILAARVYEIALALKNLRKG